jgi:transposase-like protein
MNYLDFKCPECGSSEVGGMQFVDTCFDPADAWSGVLQRYRCAKCRSVIPAHLGERWDGISFTEAQGEWQLRYRNNQPNMGN